MSDLIHINSKEQFSSLLSSSTIVVTDFYADWCPPCKAIAPMYQQLATQLSRPNRITFTKVNVDKQQEIARAYGITVMPTFIIFKNARIVSTIQGANTAKLSEAVRKLASEASAIPGSEGDGFDSPEKNTVNWVGITAPKGYDEVTDQVHASSLDLLNRDSELGPTKVLFDPSEPSALAAESDQKGKDKAQETPDWVESDTDEQMMLYIPFNSTLKVQSLQITSLPPKPDSGEDGVPMRPRTLHLYINRPHVLGFEEAEDIPPVQKVMLEPQDWDSKTGTAKIELRFVKFQKVTSLIIFFVDGDGNEDKIRVDRLRVFGETGEKLEMGKLEKIGDEPGE